MGNPLSLVAGAVGQAPERLIYGEIAPNNPACPLPTTFNQPLYVVMADWDRTVFWKVTNWPCIHGNTLPAAGAECLLIYDNRRNLRCVWWDGVHT